MAAFDYTTEAELFPTRNRKSRRQPLRYRRFAQAADAIRFAIEELPREIRRLYESTDYPLARRKAA